jgi:tetratricopeptide (TPR) repeat protein
LSADQVSQLGLPREWEFREAYADHRPPGQHDTLWASHFNEIGAADRALEYVKLARAEGYTSARLELENGFALNVMERYDEAARLLTEAARRYPDEADITAELAYAHLSLQEYQRAIALYRRALGQKGAATARRWEFANNIANAYRQLGDPRSEREWREKSIQWKKPTQ